MERDGSGEGELGQNWRGRGKENKFLAGERVGRGVDIGEG